MKTKILYIVLIISLLCGKNLMAQSESCPLVLKKAQRLYDEGSIEEIPQLLETCLAEGFNQKETLEAYKLLILVYLFDDNKVEAERYMLEFLKVEPNYKVNETVDPAEFINLFKTYRTSAVNQLGIVAGSNMSMIKLLETYSLGDLNTVENEYNAKVGMGFQVGVTYYRFLMPNLYLNAELKFGQNKYNYVEHVNDFNDVNTVETMSWISIPVCGTYDLMAGKRLTPFVRLGGSANYLLSSNINAVRSYTDQSNPDVTGTNVDVTALRKSFNFLAILGAGAKYEINKWKLTFDIRYNYGMLNVIKAENRYDQSDLLYKYFYVDNDFAISNLSFNVGYVYCFYMPKKIEEKVEGKPAKPEKE